MNQLFLSDEIDRVNIVKYTSYTKEHRAYFTREGLMPVVHGKKYLFLYHPKHQNLYVLLRKKHQCLLYNMSVPNTGPKKYTCTSTRKLIHALQKAGYKQPGDLERLGFVIRTGFRRYKGIKTIMIDVKDYRPLKKEYEQAIRTYNASKLSGIHTSLPKKMILPYFTRYYNRAQTPKQKEALRKIAKKLNIGISEQPDEQPDLIQPLFPYYLHQASFSELDAYLQTAQSKEELGYGERSLLEHRLEEMKRKKLLEEASLERLIEEYKKNPDPEFKKNILSRIKELRSK
jgi:hypothetical protein